MPQTLAAHGAVDEADGKFVATCGSGEEASWRPIARLQGGTWQVNVAEEGDTAPAPTASPWVDAARNDMHAALSEAFAGPAANRALTAGALSQLNAAVLTEAIADASLDVAVALHTTDPAAALPEVERVTVEGTAWDVSIVQRDANTVRLYQRSEAATGTPTPTTAPTVSPAYAIEHSLMLDGSSDYLSKTFAGAGDNPDRFVFATWVKKLENAVTPTGSPTPDQGIHSLFSAGTSHPDSMTFHFGAIDNIDLEEAGASIGLDTSSKYLDTSRWMHLVFSGDSTEAAEADRLQGWVDGVPLVFDAQTNEIDQHTDYSFFQAFEHAIGRDQYNVGNHYANVLLADTLGLDGQSIQAG
ncbi:MAG: hypothetical protein VX747_09530, partial [Actinomycetota bacterium]|nr:hypothetical protein [Actinomycetota bacterium]